MMGMCFTVESVPNKEGSSESYAVKNAQCNLVCPHRKAGPWELHWMPQGYQGPRAEQPLCKAEEHTGSLCSFFYACCSHVSWCMWCEVFSCLPVSHASIWVVLLVSCLLAGPVRCSEMLSPCCFSICSLVLRGLVFPSPPFLYSLFVQPCIHSSSCLQKMVRRASYG